MNALEPNAAEQRADERRLMLYTVYRARVTHEYDLINHRMMWMVLTQAFMLALWTSIPLRLLHTNSVQIQWPRGLIATGGLILTFASFHSFRAAQREIARMCRDYARLTRPYASLEPIFPALEGSARISGHVAAWAMMAFLALLWIALVVLSVST